MPAPEHSQQGIQERHDQIVSLIRAGHDTKAVAAALNVARTTVYLNLYSMGTTVAEIRAGRVVKAPVARGPGRPKGRRT